MHSNDEMNCHVMEHSASEVHSRFTKTMTIKIVALSKKSTKERFRFALFVIGNMSFGWFYLLDTTNCKEVAISQSINYDLNKIIVYGF